MQVHVAHIATVRDKIASRNTAQTVCRVHSQYIKDHADVGGYPGSSVAYDSFIYSQWNTWNSLITVRRLQKMLRATSQGSMSSTSVVRASYYGGFMHNMRTKLTNFNVKPRSRYPSKGIRSSSNSTRCNSLHWTRSQRRVPTYPTRSSPSLRTAWIVFRVTASGCIHKCLSPMRTAAIPRAVF